MNWGTHCRRRWNIQLEEHLSTSTSDTYATPRSHSWLQGNLQRIPESACRGHTHPAHSTRKTFCSPQKSKVHYRYVCTKIWSCQGAVASVAAKTTLAEMIALSHVAIVSKHASDIPVTCASSTRGPAGVFTTSVMYRYAIRTV